MKVVVSICPAKTMRGYSTTGEYKITEELTNEEH